MKCFIFFSIFDPEGQVDEYIYYCCFQWITKKGHRLSQYSDNVIDRENIGFDGGAYADVLTNHLSYKEIQKFDVIVLCNDTCYGPFVPMRDIFDKMDAQENDFGGIQYCDE